MSKTCFSARKLFLRKLGRAEVRTTGEGSEEKKGKSWGGSWISFSNWIKLRLIIIQTGLHVIREGMNSQTVNFSIEYVFKSFPNMKGNVEYNWVLNTTWTFKLLIFFLHIHKWHSNTHCSEYLNIYFHT